MNDFLIASKCGAGYRALTAVPNASLKTFQSPRPVLLPHPAMKSGSVSRRLRRSSST